MALRLTLAVGAFSILCAIAGNYLAGHLLLTPERVVAGELWQVVTYAMVVPLPNGGAIFSFLISLYFLYAIGSQVEAVLGSKRLLGFYLGTTALGALVTIPVAFLAGKGWVTFSGLWVGLGALTVLFAHQYARQPIYLMFVLPIQGKQLVWVSFGILALFAILDGPLFALPAFVGMMAALAFANGLFRPRRAWLRFRAWRIERDLTRRTKRFSVIQGEKKSDTNVVPLQKKDDGRGGPWVH